MSDEMLYDDDAMNNALSFVAAANSKLVVANSDYASDKLSGKKFISDSETIIDEAGTALRSAENALSGLNESGSFLTFDFSPEEDSTNIITIEIGDTIILNGENPDRKAIEALQRQLFRLGYYGDLYDTEDEAADGVWGSNTRNALMQFLIDNGMEDVEIGDELSSSIFFKVMNSKETREEARQRIMDEQSGEIKEILEGNIAINATSEEDMKFNLAIIQAMFLNNQYSKEAGNRETGNRVMNGSGYTDGVVYFDCSSFASTIMQQAYGIKCVRDDGGLYSTRTFESDTSNFKHDEVNGEIDVSQLQKGQLILCLDKIDRGYTSYNGIYGRWNDCTF